MGPVLVACHVASAPQVPSFDAAPDRNLAALPPSRPPAEAQRAELRACELSLPPSPPEHTANAGPAYLLVGGVGLLALTDEGVHEVLRLDSDANARMTVDPGGELWVSDTLGLRVVSLDGKVRQIPSPRDTRYERLEVRSANDVWAVIEGQQWSVAHFDGRRWRTVEDGIARTKYTDDDELVTLVFADEAVWFGSTMGVWRGVDDRWQQVSGSSPHAHVLASYRGRLLDHDELAAFVDESEHPRSDDARLRLVVSELGIVAWSGSEATVRLASILGEGCTASSPSLPGSHVLALEFDATGRVWATTDRGLAVVEPDGRIVAQWIYGALPQLTGPIRRVAIAGAGPKQLPPAIEPRTRTLIGQMRHADGPPPVGVTIELCSIATREPCPPASTIAITTTAEVGTFRFDDVPDGDLWMRVELGPNTCTGLFYEPELGPISLARDCSTTGDDKPCRLRPQTVCQRIPPCTPMR